MLDSYYTWPRPDVAALVPHTARKILDVGCGAGKLGELLKSRQQCCLTGIEVNEDAALAACQGAYDTVFPCDVEDEECVLYDTYDCVICADVLEHLRDPWRVLDMLLAHLEPGGHLVVSIPNVRNQRVIADLLDGIWEYQPAGILDRTHLRFFTPQGFANLLGERGLTLLEARAVGQSVHPFAGTRPMQCGRFTVEHCTYEDLQQFSAEQILYLAQKG